MASVATWGSTSFADNEVNLVNVNTTSRFSQRNRRLQNIVSMQCFGEIQAANVALIVAQANAYDAALSVNNQDFRYTVAGSIAHAMLNDSSCLSGTRIVQKSFPKGDGTELANRRSFSFTVQAVYDAVDDDLVSWQESVETVGDGGPRFFILESALTVPVGIVTANNTVVAYNQRGMAVGYSAYPTPPGPVNPAGEMRAARRITRMSAQQLGNGLRFFPIKWSYVMYRDFASFGPAEFLPFSQ